MPYVNASGTKLWYEVAGSGTPLVLIGGFALLNNQFDFCREFLHEAKIRTIDWNQRGLGDSSRSITEPLSLERWVEDLRAVLDAAGIERVSIWGTSTGSSIGMRFAAKYPERMNTLITYPSFHADQYWRNVYSAAYTVASVFGIRQLSRVFAGVVLTEDSFYSEQHFTYERWAGGIYEKNVSVPSMRHVMDALSAIDLTGDIPEIRCPTTLLMGRDSALNRKEGMESASFDKLVREFLRLKPDATVEAIEGAGSTYCMITHPRETADRVIKVLSTLPR
jgi:pimeloyl-ACP methyl ester carboxylesterase